MYDEYDPISLFKCNSCFRVNTQTFWEPTLKLGLSKMYPYFKLLIFGYISRFLTKFLTLLGFFYALNTNPPLFFVLDLGNGLQWGTPYEVKPPFWGFNLVWGTFPWSKSKNSFGFEFSMPKKPLRTKNQPNWKTFFFRIFKKFSKLIFCSEGFFGWFCRNMSYA